MRHVSPVLSPVHTWTLQATCYRFVSFIDRSILPWGQCFLVRALAIRTKYIAPKAWLHFREIEGKLRRQLWSLSSLKTPCTSINVHTTCQFTVKQCLAASNT